MPKYSIFVVQVLMLISLLLNYIRDTKEVHAVLHNTSPQSTFKIVAKKPENEFENVSLQTKVKAKFKAEIDP